MAMRSQSLPLRGSSGEVLVNPFWSEKAANEAHLAGSRPSELPPVPDDGSWENGSSAAGRPIENDRDGRNGDPRTSRDRSRPRRNPRSGQSGPSSAGTFRTIPTSWEEPGLLRTEGVMRLDASMEQGALRTEGAMGMETPEGDGWVHAATASDGLERDLEKALFEKIQEENQSLKLELERVRMMMKVSSSGWSEVSGDGCQSPQPPPPPPERKEEKNRHTPNGTQVPEGPPPTGEMPPWPFPVDVEEYEMADESGRWMWLGPRPPPVTTGLSQQSVQRLDERTGWIEQELMGMKKALEAERRRAMASGRALTGEYWQQPCGRGEAQPGGQPLSRVLGGLPQGNRALEQRPQSRVLGEVCGQDRAAAGTNGQGVSHGDRARPQSRVLVKDVNKIGLLQDSTVMENFEAIGLVSINPWAGFMVDYLKEICSKGMALVAGDWLAQIRPYIADVASSAGVWWDRAVGLVSQRYAQWLGASAIDRLKIEPPSSLEIADGKVRLEQRITTLLLSAIPQVIRADLVASRQLHVGGILFSIYKRFQPGGHGERQATLQSLTSTIAAKSAEDAVVKLREWKRRVLRAQELGASLPDPTIQVHALEVITSQVLAKESQASFRVSAFRMAVQLDNNPSQETTLQFFDMLLSECEQLQYGLVDHGEDNGGGVQSANPKVKAVKAGQGKGQSSGGGSANKCRHWGTESGCRFGKQCRFDHPVLADAASRCWLCSSSLHRKNECPYRSGMQLTGVPTGGSDGSCEKGVGKGKNKDGKGGKTAAQKRDEDQTTSMSSSTTRSSENADKNDTVEKCSQVRAYQVSRISSRESQRTLLDGGATHCLRAARDRREWMEGAPVSVQLAAGSAEMKINATTKTLLVEASGEPIQQIIPLNKLTDIGYEIRLLERIPGKHDWSGHELPFNRRRRRQIEQAKKVVIHLFAGKEDPCWKKEEGNGTVVVCLDVLGGCDLLNNQHLAGWLEDLAKRGKVNCWLSGPPCRTTSMLRNKQDGGPPQLRGKGKDRFGLESLTGDQWTLVDGDSVLWLRSLWWMYLGWTHGAVAEHLLEQPRDPEEWCPRSQWPEGGCPSFMSWEETQAVCSVMGLKVALSLKERQEIQAWQDHHRAGHLPHRKDCPTCLLAAGRDRQHKRQACPTSYTLSFDILGPFCPGQDQQGNGFRYGLVAVYTVPVDGSGAPLPEGLAELRAHAGVRRDQGDEEDEGVVLDPGEEGEAQQLLQEEHEEQEEIPEAVVQQQEILERKWREFIKDRRAVPVKNITFGVPIRSREASEVLSGVSKIFAKVRALQLPVTRVHTDRAREFSGGKFQRWAQDRDVFHTMCSGDSPQENARAEKEVGEVKSHMRKMLLMSRAPLSFWPLAFRQAVEHRHRSQLQQLGIVLPELIPFGSTAVVRRKEWHHRADPFRWPMMKVRVWGPCGDMAASSQGYFVQGQDGRFLRSTVVRVPAAMAEHGDLQQPIGDELSKEEAIQAEDGACQPGRLPGGEDNRGNEHDDGIKLVEENGQQMDLEEVNIEDIQVLRELAKKAEFGMEGLSQLSSGVCLQEEEKRKVFEMVPHDLPQKRCREKTTPGQVAGQPMVYKVGVEGGRSASNNWDGDSSSVAGRPSSEELRSNEEWEHVMLKQHLGLRRWMEEVAGMVNCGIATEEELQSVRNARDEIEVLEGMLTEAAVRAVQAVEPTQVLQTRIVAMDEVRKNMGEWRQAFADEVEALTSTALEPIDEARFNQLLEGPMEVECLPMKGVASLKPPCRRKARIVVCGNYASEKEDEALDNSVSGVDSVCIRTFINAAVQYNWTAGSIDVSKAFLQAPRRTATKRITIGMPPRIVTDMDLVPKGQRWIIHQALYGLTESPGDWSAHRDGELSILEWSMEDDTYKLEKTPERNVWRIKKKVADSEGDRPLGFLLTYVDDMLILGGDQLVKSTAEAIGRRWQCSAPEYLQEDAPMRFCGFELTKVKQGIRLDQFGYTQELLKKYNVEGVEACPLAKLPDEETTEEPFTAEDLRKAQSIVGEVLWLSTRTRPDLAFGVGLLGRLVHKKPQTVVSLGMHMLKYIKNTSDWGLVYEQCSNGDFGEEDELQQPRTVGRVQAYADISFAPAREAYRSIQGIGIQHGKNLIAWESCRQPFVCASTAESELVSYCEAHQVTESVTGLLEVANFNPDRQLYGDNRAALAAITNETGNWRTRHLRLRAFALREALADPSRRWVARHLSGTMLLADGLTKPLQGGAFENYRRKLGLKPREDSKPGEDGEVGSNWKNRGAAVALLLGSVGLMTAGNPRLAALLGAVAGVSLAMNLQHGGCQDGRAWHGNAGSEQVRDFKDQGHGRASMGSSRPEEGLCPGGVCSDRALHGQQEIVTHSGALQEGDERPKIRAFRPSGAKGQGDGEQRGYPPRRDGGALQRGRDAMTSTLTEAFAGLSITTNVTVNIPAPTSSEPTVGVKESKKKKKGATSRFMDAEAEQLRATPGFEPWRLQQFLEPPKGEDRWDLSFLSDGWLLRTHGTRGRVKPFHPIHRSCPVPGDELTGDRVTALFNHDGGEWLYDKWTDARTWQRAGPWRGYTFLNLKPAVVKSTGAASSDSRRGKHDGGEEDVESSSDGSYSLVAAASER
eukprot:symbB.v1.2.022715.t1/scaffold2026.1/size92022/4